MAIENSKVLLIIHLKALGGRDLLKASIESRVGDDLGLIWM